MKVFTNKKQLSAATSRVQGAITERSMAQIGMKSEAGILKLSATDRILAIYCNIECKSEQDGEVFVPAKLFSDVVRELPQGEVQLSTEGTWLTITAGEKDSYSMKLPLISELSWREAPNAENQNHSDIPSSKLSYMISQVQFCIAQESPRNYGTVGYLHKTKEGNLRLVGTDSFRLSYCDIEFKTDDKFLSQGVCVSKRALGELSRMCGEGFETVSISISEDGTTLIAEVPDYKIFIRLSAVKYPNYQGVLPKEQPSSVDVNRGTIQSMAKRVLLAADKTRALQLRFSPSSLTISSKTMGSSESRENLSLDGYQGYDCNLAVNGKFFSDVFSTTSSDTLTLKFKDEDNPIVIIPTVEPKNCRSRHVLVPIKESH